LRLSAKKLLALDVERNLTPINGASS